MTYFDGLFIGSKDIWQSNQDDIICLHTKS